MKSSQITSNDLTFEQFALIGEETRGEETCLLYSLENFRVAIYKFDDVAYKLQRQVLILGEEPKEYPIEFKNMENLIAVVNILRKENNG